MMILVIQMRINSKISINSFKQEKKRKMTMRRVTMRKVTKSIMMRKSMSSSYSLRKKKMMRK